CEQTPQSRLAIHSTSMGSLPSLGCMCARCRLRGRRKHGGSLTSRERFDSRRPLQRQRSSSPATSVWLRGCCNGQSPGGREWCTNRTASRQRSHARCLCCSANRSSCLLHRSSGALNAARNGCGSTPPPTSASRTRSSATSGVSLASASTCSSRRTVPHLQDCC